MPTINQPLSITISVNTAKAPALLRDLIQDNVPFYSCTTQGSSYLKTEFYMPLKSCETIIKRGGYNVTQEISEALIAVLTNE